MSESQTTKHEESIIKMERMSDADFIRGFIMLGRNDVPEIALANSRLNAIANFLEYYDG